MLWNYWQTACQILSLSNKTLEYLKQKRPDPKKSLPETLRQDPFRLIHPVAYDNISEYLILIIWTAILTKAGCEPSGLDANGWRRILTSRKFGNSSSNRRKAFANFMKKPCSKEPQFTHSLEAFTANRLVPPDKNPGLRPIGFGEALRRIAGNIVIMLCKKDFTKAAGSLQLSAGQDAGADAAIHALRQIFVDFDTDVVLLIDAENAFNSTNRKLTLQSLKIICPVIATYTVNCYATPWNLFIIDGAEILYSKGTTQGDPTAMGAYA